MYDYDAQIALYQYTFGQSVDVYKCDCNAQIACSDNQLIDY